MELVAGKLYRHIKSGEIYQIIDTKAKVQINGIWHPAVFYIHHEYSDGYKFCRTVEDFKKSFEIAC